MNYLSAMSSNKSFNSFNFSPGKCGDRDSLRSNVFHCFCFSTNSLACFTYSWINRRENENEMFVTIGFHHLEIFLSRSINEQRRGEEEKKTTNIKSRRLLCIQLECLE